MWNKNKGRSSVKLEELYDVDVTNKLNGYVLTYDSTTDNYKTKPLPAGMGNDTVNYSYLIELNRWGITQGLPTKRMEVINSVNVNCYSDSDYLKAYNNIVGINNAMIWAYDNGYRHVVIPFGNYSLCHSLVSDNDKENRIVINYNNFTLDLNGSTFKVMFDSAKRSPYDKLRSSGGTYLTNTNPPFQLSNSDNGYVGFGLFIIRDCTYATLKNGKIIGDKIDRDFIIQAEKACEGTYGVAAGGNCKYATVDNIDVSFFMGDGMTVSLGKSNTLVGYGFNMGWQVGNLDANGLFVSSTTNCVSDYIIAQPSTAYYIRGLGDTKGMTSLRSRRHSTYCYDINKVFIGRLKDSYVLRGFTTMKNTAFIRFVVEEGKLDPPVPDVTVGGWQLFLYKGLYGEFTTFSNNYIHHNHRGGLSQSLNDTYIINNHFYNNGESYDYENNLSGFEQANGIPFSTRYHINVEDITGYNMHIIGNRFDNGRLGIAVRGQNYIIKDNIFKDNVGVILYRVHFAEIKDNYFDNASFDTFPYNTEYNTLIDYNRNWFIDGNTLDGDFNIRGTAVVHSITNNIFKSKLTIESKVNVFSQNTFNIEKDFSTVEYFSLKTIDMIEGCVFTKSSLCTSLNSFTIWNASIINCTFKNLKVRVQDVALKNCIINDSGFEILNGAFIATGSRLNYGNYLLKNNYATSDNSAMISFVNTSNPIKLEFIDCDITSAHSHGLFGSYLNQTANASLKLENTRINRTTNNKMGFNLLNGSFNLSNSTISSEIAAGNFVPNGSLNHRFIDCIFTNISFTIRTSDIQYSQQDIGMFARPLSGSGAPVGLPQKVGQEYFDLTNKKLYKAFGTSSSTDWIVMN